MRLHGLDIARAFAFFGMVLVNFRIAAEVTDGPDPATALVHALEGRAAALFVVLAGIGVALSGAGPALLARRAVFLFVLGLLNMTVFDADILHFYALYFIGALPFLRASARQLSVLIAAVLGLALILLVTLNYDAGWDWDSLSYEGLWTLPGFARHSLYNGWHPVLPWIAFLFFGMALARLDLAARVVQHRLIWIGTGVAALTLLPGLATSDPELSALLGTSPIPPSPFYMLSAGASAAAVTGLILRLSPAQPGAVLSSFAATGRQSLTLYIAHILLGMGALEALGLLGGTLSSMGAFYAALIFCALSLIYATLWQRVARRGPLEAMMRKLAG
ncbi:MAG: DUF418 domain-containing protein [Pelagimonas sp.]|jgi:uncharacterized membrane protein YeiB|nr:DUF418 domain-containing protein [Pelagimonas sp.]